MNKLLVCAALGLALAVTEISAKPCSSFTGEKCRKKGCDWSKSDGAKFKTCKEVAPVVETPVVEGDASVCAQYSRGKGCRKAGCAFTRKNGKKSGKRTCNLLTPAPTSAPTPAPTPALDTASESDSPSESPSEGPFEPYDGPWLAKDGCCRDSESESKKSIQGVNTPLTVGLNFSAATEECAFICSTKSECPIKDARERRAGFGTKQDVLCEGCTGFEVTTKKKKGNKGKSMHTCELHTGNVDKTTRKTKSCKRAVCTVMAFNEPQVGWSGALFYNDD